VADAIDDGEVKIGGASNFGVKHLEELLATKPRVIPAVNQYISRITSDIVTEFLIGISFMLFADISPLHLILTR
jgi:hypothetical protein